MQNRATVPLTSLESFFWQFLGKICQQQTWDWLTHTACELYFSTGITRCPNQRNGESWFTHAYDCSAKRQLACVDEPSHRDLPYHLIFLQTQCFSKEISSLVQLSQVLFNREINGMYKPDQGSPSAKYEFWKRENCFVYKTRQPSPPKKLGWPETKSGMSVLLTHFINLFSVP